MVWGLECTGVLSKDCPGFLGDLLTVRTAQVNAVAVQSEPPRHAIDDAAAGEQIDHDVAGPTAHP
jgi:hypothetical protein